MVILKNENGEYIPGIDWRSRIISISLTLVNRLEATGAEKRASASAVMVSARYGYSLGL
jgi:hypothetical protein